MRFFIITITCLLMSTLLRAQNNRLLVGTYTNNSDSKGIYVFNFNLNTGKTTALDTITSADPSFLTLSPDNKFVYAVNELGEDKGGGTVSAFSFDAATGKLRFINQQATHGNHPCYVTIDQKGKTVFAGNYSSGNLASFNITATGALTPATATIQHTGSGPNKDRQEGPHVHCTILSPDNRWLFVTDLGTDKITTYPFNATTGVLQVAALATTAAPPGAGPRHLAFSQNGTRLYLIAELNGAVIVYNHKDGKLTPIQTLHSLPADKQSPANSADIHLSPDGKFLYVTHRINNTIALFSVNAVSGKLKHIETVPTNGLNPRNFTISPDGRFLLVAHQNSNNIVVFKRNPSTGKLTDTKENIEVAKPVCLIWSNTP